VIAASSHDAYRAPAAVPPSSRLALEAGGSDAIGSNQTTTARRDAACQAASRADYQPPKLVRQERTSVLRSDSFRDQKAAPRA
jgi:hypothetical protein